MAVRNHRELIPKSVIGMHSHPQPDPNVLDQMSKNITRQGITSSTLNYLRVSSKMHLIYKSFCILTKFVQNQRCICKLFLIFILVIVNVYCFFHQLCVILEPMQELMSRHKAYSLNPRDCLKTTLFQKWQRMVAPPGKRGTLLTINFRLFSKG